MQQNTVSLIKPEETHLIILPTEQCNFRCTYCYESYICSKMKKNIQEGITKYISNKFCNLNSLFISWFGGEPLLAKDIVLEMSNTFVEGALNNNFKYQADMSTNGYLLDIPTLNSLLSAGISRFQITLDGHQKIHDKYRQLANGAGSFSRIWRNLISAKESPLSFIFLLRIHYSPDNLYDIKHLKKTLVNEFGGDERFKFYFRPLNHLGGSNDNSFAIFCTKDANNIAGYFEDIPQENRYFPDSHYPVCYAAKPTSFAFRPNGKIVKCTVALDDPKNDVGTINSSGKLKINNKKLFPWISGVLEHDENKTRCPLKNIKT